MLGTKAYNQAYSYREYKNAKDYSDLLTSFANDIEQVEANYNTYGFDKRKRKFNPNDTQETNKHAVAFQFERHIDIASSAFT